MKDIQGTIIHGTLRNEDVIPALYNYLRDMKDIGIVPEDEYPALLDMGSKLIVEIDKITDWDSENATEIALELFTAIEGFLPEGYYCGAIEGDGSDFGIWRHEEDAE